MSETTAERFWDDRYAARPGVWSGRPNPLLAEAVADLPPGRALDLGCGVGGDTVHLAALGWEVTAVDVSGTALARTRENAEAKGVAGRVRTERHDLADTFPEGVFDLVSAQYLQTPLDFPRDRALRRAARALVPGGLLLVVDHGSAAPWSELPEGFAGFPTPREVFGGLALDPAEFHAERLDTPQRRATGPNGETALVTDTVIAVRRIAPST